MRTIDAFNHFFLRRFFEAFLQTPPAAKHMGKRVRGIPAPYDLDQCMRVVGSFPDHPQRDHSKYEINSVIGWPFETGAAFGAAGLVRHRLITTPAELSALIRADYDKYGKLRMRA